jgi:predicted metalloprotease with PDZ domain
MPDDCQQPKARAPRPVGDRLWIHPAELAALNATQAKSRRRKLAIVGGTALLSIAAPFGFATLAPMPEDERQVQQPAWFGAAFAPTANGCPCPIVDVQPGSPAQLAGLQIRDRMVAVDGQPVGRVSAVNDLFALRSAGQRVRVEVDRAGQHLWFELTLNTLP